MPGVLAEGERKAERAKAELVEANLGDRKQLMLKALTRLRVPGGDDVGRLREPLVASHVRAEVLDADEAVETTAVVTAGTAAASSGDRS